MQLSSFERVRQHVLILAFAVLAAAPLRAMDKAAPPPADGSLLTLDRIFSFKEFEAESPPDLRWSRRASAYFLLQKPQDGKGRDLVRFDLDTGRSDVIVPAANLIPKDAKEPLAIDSFEFSRDESQLLIYTNSQKVWRQKTRGDYWTMNLTTRELRKLGGDAAPATMMFAKFSPDGTQVGYVRDNNVYVQNLQTLAITALTTDGSPTLINGTADWVNEEELKLRDCFRWSPDSQNILFWQFDTSGVSSYHLINNVVSNSPRVTTFAYPKVGEKNSATRLGIVPIAGGSVRWLNIPGDPREHYLPHAEWTRDGNLIQVQQFNRLQNELTVWRVDPQTGEARELMNEVDPAWIENDNPFRWLGPETVPMPSREFLWLSERSGWRHAYRVSPEGKLSPITQGSFDVMEIEAIDPAGDWLYYSASPKNATQRYLYRIKPDGSHNELLTPVDQPGWHRYDISPDGKWAIHTRSRMSSPPVIELVRLADHSVEKTLIDNQKLREKLARLQQPEIEFFPVDIGGGVTLDGWSIKPAQIPADAKLPLLMYVYGEPHGQTVRDAWTGPRGLWHWMLAQQGFVIASVDNRGTNVPRGRDWRKVVHRQVGVLAPQEQAHALENLLDRWSFIDRTRVGIWGWSGGGSMSLHAIFRYPELYRTAISIAPVADERLYDTIYEERYMGLPSDNEKGYRDGSPLTHAGKLRGNLLLIHGTGDDNCHYQGTERLIDDLIARGKHFSVLPYPNRSHSISEGANTDRHMWGLMTRYLQDNLQSPTAPAPEPVHETRNVRGWRLHIHRELMAKEPQLTAKAIELLNQQLEEIQKVVPEKAVAELQKVPLYFNPEYEGVPPRAEYHPDAGWLRENGRDPDMAQCVEFTDIRNFEAETNRMPNFTLHELAHAYHDRVLPLGFGNEKIQAAFARARDSGTYDKVERHFGNGRPNATEKAYAMSNPMEYFAETTEAFFSRNDFFPFNREELKLHDPQMFELLEKLWQ